MISHGVDTDKFNFIFFYGITPFIAEFIQAYSRVGRRSPGLVITVLRPTREKDKSYLKNFVKFNEFKEILVEPVPINRWAANAIEKTFPGIFIGLIINYYDLSLQMDYGNLHMMENFKKAVLDEKLNKNKIIEQLLSAYGCLGVNNTEKKLGDLYKDYIVENVNKIFSAINNYTIKSKNLFIGQGIEEIIGRGPLNNLRNTDTQILIQLG